MTPTRRPIARLLMTTALAVVVGLSVSVRAHDEEGPHDELFKIGKQGEVKFDNDITFGDVVIKKGKYVVAHRVGEAGEHVLTLSGANSKTPGDAAVREIPTRFIAGTETAKASVVIAEERRDSTYRVKAVRIAGETGDHICG